MSFKVLAAQSDALKSSYPTGVRTPEDEAWEGSPFDWFRKKASATKGKIGRDLVASVLDSNGFDPARRGMGFEVNKRSIRVRTSLMWGGGDFKFEQFRDTDFDFVFCLGLYPESAYGWLIPKGELIQNGNLQDREGLTPQHGGQAGTEDFWLSINTSSTPAWLEPYGGSIDAISKVLRRNL